ncbi:MAG TPA: LPS export ABC transporter periplasmic protein LptC [Chthoniobacterales bacterium]
MPRWLNLFIAGVLAFGVVATSTLHAQDAEPKKKKKEKRTPDPDAPKFNLVVPPGQPAKGIHLPYYNLEGVLRMQFDADGAVRTGEDTVDLTNLRIESFDDSGASEMLINLPTATLNMRTNLISSTDDVTVKRRDFQITGKGMEFNTQDKSGRFLSNTRMEIFDRSSIQTKTDRSDLRPVASPSQPPSNGQ